MIFIEHNVNMSTSISHMFPCLLFISHVFLGCIVHVSASNSTFDFDEHFLEILSTNTKD